MSNKKQETDNSSKPDYREANNLTEEDYYINENNLVTFTAAYLAKRGYCCGSGCRHCPYPNAIKTKSTSQTS